MRRLVPSRCDHDVTLLLIQGDFSLSEDLSGCFIVSPPIALPSLLLLVQPILIVILRGSLSPNDRTDLHVGRRQMLEVSLPVRRVVVRGWRHGLKIRGWRTVLLLENLGQGGG